ncbi:hypothetical protein WN944_005853 [Citrus x changshan-huyou]|uniref:Uncharacterized protein n=1 Tax=Citrus x changshan-huyou TaxID=2935761 RepID=A0AAP0QP60_9ROSI
MSLQPTDACAVSRTLVPNFDLFLLIACNICSVYMDIEAVVGGDLLTVASVIPEQYSLKKLWADIRDLCFDQPIKHATKVRFQVMFPWEMSYATLKTETDLQDAFNKLREKKYSWVIFIIKTELDELEKDRGDSGLPKDRNDEDESPDA